MLAAEARAIALLIAKAESNPDPSSRASKIEDTAPDDLEGMRAGLWPQALAAGVEQSQLDALKHGYLENEHAFDTMQAEKQQRWARRGGGGGKGGKGGGQSWSASSYGQW